MEILSIPLGPIETNCYILADSGRALLIDAPPGCGERIERELKQRHWQLSAVVLTHGHWDHTLGASELSSACPEMTVMAHADDRLFIENPNLMSAYTYPGINLTPIFIDRWLKDGESFEIGAISLKALHTPGHSPGSISLLLDNSDGIHCFCGDLIFHDSIGRYDFPGGNKSQLFNSIHSSILSLDDNATLYPGHGIQTTVGRERENNPYL